jgi:hypothetical protein
MKGLKFLAWLCACGLISLTAACGGGGGGEDGITTSTLSGGQVIDGYLSGATVCVDYDNDGQCDSDTQTTDQNGTYNSFTIPTTYYANATLLAFGGFDTSTNQTFEGVLMAQPGSNNITPLTTLIAVNPEIEQSLTDLGVTADADYVSGSINGAYVQLALMVASSLQVMATTTNISDSAILAKGTEQLANALNDSLKTIFSNNNELADISDSEMGGIFANATRDGLQGLNTATENNEDYNTLLNMNATSIANLDLTSQFTNIANAVDQNSTALLDTLVTNSTAITQATENATGTVEEQSVTSFSFDAGSVSLAGASLVLDNSTGKWTSTISSATLSSNKQFAIDFLLQESAGALKDFTNVRFILHINDTGSSREATVTLSGVSISVDGENITSLTVAGDAGLRVQGTDSNGNQIDVTFTNIEGDQLILTTSTQVTYDLSKIEDKIVNETQSNDALHQISYPGTYNLIIYSPDLPMDTIEASVTVE